MSMNTRTSSRGSRRSTECQYVSEIPTESTKCHIVAENPAMDEKENAPVTKGIDITTTAGASISEKDECHISRADSTSQATKKQAQVTVTSENAEPGATEVETTPDNIIYPTGFKLAMLTFGLCMAQFVVALDNTVIATAVPRITTDFDSLGDVGWYGSSYLLTTTSLQPSFGKVYTYFSIKWTYIWAFGLFEVGSIVCAAAPSSLALIIGRSIAGAGAAALFSGSLTIIGYTVPLSKRAMYIGAVSAMFGVASVVGPLIGGVFTDRLSWRWCFWINLPFGGIAIAAVMIWFKDQPNRHGDMTIKAKILEIDLLGAVCLISSIICLLLALQWGNFKYPWSSSKVWGNILGFGLLLIVFIYIQFRRDERATIPPRIFTQRTVLISALFSLTLNMGLYNHIFYLPFYFQAIKGTTAERSGIDSIPLIATLIFASIVVGIIITIVGFYKPFMIVSGAIYTIASGLIYTFRVDTPTARWAGYELLAGIGAGIGLQIPFTAVQVVLSAEEMPTGNAIAIFFNSLGGAISVSIAQNLFQSGLIKNIPKYSSKWTAHQVIEIGASHLRESIPPDELPAVLEGYMAALTDTYVLPMVVGGLATILACFVEWRSVKGKKVDVTVAA